MLQNTDSSLLPTISFPCFATHDEHLYNRTKDKIVRKLQGTYGFKRFLRDGYGTAVEDTEKQYYEQGETKVLYSSLFNYILEYSSFIILCNNILNLVFSV